MDANRKVKFIEFLEEINLGKSAIRNYCSWIKRTEERLPLILNYSDIISEVKIVEILNRLKQLPQYSRRKLLNDTGTALRKYAQFLAEENSTATDIKDLIGESPKEPLSTLLLTLIEARLGQGKFRRGTMRFGDNRCSVTGCADIDLLIASHIKPWRNSTNEERLDGENGLLLIPNLDKLFDRGLISFSDKGAIMFSGNLSKDTIFLFGLNPNQKLSKTSSKLRRYLHEHRLLHGF